MKEMQGIVDRDPDFMPFIFCAAMTSMIAATCRCAGISYDKYHEVVSSGAEAYKFMWDEEDEE